MAKQSPDKRVETVMRNHDLTLVSLRICDVFLRILYDIAYLFQDLLRQMRPCVNYVLRYPLCPRLQLHVLLLRLRRLRGDLV